MAVQQSVRGYDLFERIGAGGFGAVYRAFQPILGREVAIKVILPQFANQPEFIRRFETEAQTVARLEHPHIVPLFDYWREPDSAYLVMRLIRGGSLTSLLKQGAWSLERTLALIDQIASALHVAHRAGVIHRDIKPDNILIDQDDNAYLTDFGIAQIMGKSSEEKEFSGSIGYIAPEQLVGGHPLPQSDIYALAIVVYEMLKGEHPYVGSSISQMMIHHLHDPLPDISDLPNIPPAINAVLQRATSKDPEERYDTTREFAFALRQALAPSDVIIELPDDTVLLNPYKGLRPFEQADSDDFYGREALVGQLLDRLSQGNPNFLAVVGPSGSGKSSVVKAGLVPALRNGILEGSDTWFFAEMTPGANPIQSLESALLSVATQPPDNLTALLQKDKHGFLNATEAMLGSRTNLLVVIDQFEEVFTLCEDENTRLHFLNSLTTAVTTANSHVRLIITLRADFYDKPLLYSGIGTLVQANTQVVLPMDADEIERAVSVPAQRAGAIVDSDLLAQIVSDVSEEVGALPLLQYALTELFERRDGRRMTLSAYQANGGVLGALAGRAEELYQELPLSQQNLLRQTFLRLVTLGEGTEDTRRRARLTELNAIGANFGTQGTADVRKILDIFGKNRLLTFDTEAVTRQPTVEVAHEALIRTWERLKEWLANSRSDIRQQRLLANSANDWQNNGRTKDYLLTGGRLIQFDEWANSTSLSLSAEEQAFLQASRDEQTRLQAIEKERQARELELERQAVIRLRGLVAVLVVGVLAAIGLTVFAFVNANEAQIARATSDANVIVAQDARSTSEANLAAAQASRLVALAGNELDGQNPNIEVSALLAIRSLNTNYNQEARDILTRASTKLYAERQGMGCIPNEGQMRVSPDAQRLFVGCTDGTFKVYNAETFAEMFSHQIDTSSVAIALSADGKQLATNSLSSPDILVWDTATLKNPTTITNDGWDGQQDINYLGFSPDNAYIAQSVRVFGLCFVRVWSLEIQAIILEKEGSCAFPAFTSDSKSIVAGENNQYHIYDITSGDIQREIPTNRFVNGTASTGNFIAISSVSNNTLYYVNSTTSVDESVFVGHTDRLTSWAVSPNQQYLASTSRDGTTRLWNIATSQELLLLTSNRTPNLAIQFLSDDHLVTLSESGELIEWNIETTQPRRVKLDNIFTTQRISPDGTLLVSADKTNTISLYTLNPFEKAHEFTYTPTSEGDVYLWVNMSPDNRYVVVGDGFKGEMVIFDVDTEQEIARFNNGDGTLGISTPSFSPDGQYIAVNNDFGVINVWDWRTATLVNTFTPDNLDGGYTHTYGLVFSPDGKFIVSDDLIWNIQTGANVPLQAPLPTQGNYIFTQDGTKIVNAGMLWDAQSGALFVGKIEEIISSTDISNDGKYLLEGRYEGVITLNDSTTAEVVASFDEPTSTGIFYVAFFDDDQRFISVDFDGNVRFWDINYRDTITYVCSRILQDLTPQDRAQYGITDTNPTCPQP
jgi:serine/threonine protein kinase/WD40 repeat protein